MIVAEWLLSSSVLCRMGFAVLLGEFMFRLLRARLSIDRICTRYLEGDEHGSHAVSCRYKVDGDRSNTLLGFHTRKVFIML